MNPIESPILFIGGGNMAGAIFSGAVASRRLDPARVVVADPGVEALAGFASQGAVTAPSATEGLAKLRELEASTGKTGQIVLAVKPQILPEVARELEGSAGDASRVAITMLAGVPSETVREKLAGEQSPRVIRVMPNTPARIRRGITAIARGAGARDGDAAVAESLFMGVGEVVAMDESMIDSFTGVAGSGPAYVFLFAEAMIAGAEAVGFSRAEAERIVRATVSGSALLMSSTGTDPAELRAQVTSKKGTTAAGLEQLEAGGVREAVSAAIRAARDRGAELAKLAAE